MQRHDPRRYGETEADPAGRAISCFGDAIECLENAFEIPFRNAGTMVADGHDRNIVIEPCGTSTLLPGGANRIALRTTLSIARRSNSKLPIARRAQKSSRR